MNPREHYTFDATRRWISLLGDTNEARAEALSKMNGRYISPRTIRRYLNNQLPELLFDMGPEMLRMIAADMEANGWPENSGEPLPDNFRVPRQRVAEGYVYSTNRYPKPADQPRWGAKGSGSRKTERNT